MNMNIDKSEIYNIYSKHNLSWNERVNLLIIKDLNPWENCSASPFCLKRLENLIYHCHDGTKLQESKRSDSLITFEAIITTKPVTVGPNFDESKVIVLNVNDENCIVKLKKENYNIFKTENISDTPLSQIRDNFIIPMRQNKNNNQHPVTLFTSLVINHEWDWNTTINEFKPHIVDNYIDKERTGIENVLDECGVGVWKKKFVVIRIPLLNAIDKSFASKAFDNNEDKTYRMNLYYDNIYEERSFERSNFNPYTAYLTLIVPCDDIKKLITKGYEPPKLQEESEDINLVDLKYEILQDITSISNIITANLVKKTKYKIMIPKIYNDTFDIELTKDNYLVMQEMEHQKNKNETTKYKKQVINENIFNKGYLKHFAPNNPDLKLDKIIISTQTIIDEIGIKIESTGWGYASDKYDPFKGIISINRPFMFIISQGTDIFSIGFLNE